MIIMIRRYGMLDPFWLRLQRQKGPGDAVNHVAGSHSTARKLEQ